MGIEPTVRKIGESEIESTSAQNMAQIKRIIRKIVILNRTQELSVVVAFCHFLGNPWSTVLAVPRVIIRS